MGYLPKHVKVKRYKHQMQVIAMAALGGAMFARTSNQSARQLYWYVPNHFHHTWGRSKTQTAMKFIIYRMVNQSITEDWSDVAA